MWATCECTNFYIDPLNFYLENCSPVQLCCCPRCRVYIVQSWCQKRNGNDPGSVWLFFLATLSKMFYSVVCVRVHMCMCWDGVNWYVLMYSQWLWTILHTYKDISIKRVRERMREKAHNLPGKQTRIGQSKWNYTSKLLKSTCSVSLLLSLSFSSSHSHTL